LLLGTAVTNPLTRHPAITAVAAATVDEISGGRMILGIGAGDRPLLALGMRPARLSSLRASIEAIRALWSGSTTSLDDPTFALHDAHLRFAARPDIPVFISASGPKTLELAGEVADGVILLVGLFPEALGWALEHVDRGAAKAGRPRPHVAVFAYGAISDDEEVAMASARSIAAWFPQTAPAVCELAGLPAALIEEVRARYAGGEFQEAQEAARLLPDEFVRSVALAGDAEQARARIAAAVEAGADSVSVFPLGADRMQTVEAFSSCFADVTGGENA
jgi:5,10-methylenetetrahydromethanopterin reductase